MVSVSGALGGQGSIAYGNAIGSIICNTALIAALTIAVKPGKADTQSLKMPVLFFFIAAAIYVVAAYVLGYFYMWVGILLLAVFVLYMIINVKKGLEKKGESETNYNTGSRSLVLQIGSLVLGAALIAFGSDLLVDNGTIIARELGVPETVIALTFIAIGTSLPELVTAITSLLKGHSALSLGNIIGANVFNLVLVSGTSVALAPFAVPVGNTVFGMNSSLVIDIPVMLLVMSLLIIPTFITKKLTRFQGILLLCIYAAFCALQFIL